MSNLKTFRFNTSTIRVVEIAGNPWFVAVDVAKVLGLPNITVTLKSKYLEASDKATTVVGFRRVNTLSESGLYKLIMRSDKPEAKPFQNWVTQVVLPAIRKDGGYILGEEKTSTGEMDEDTLVLKAMEVMRRKIERLTAENKVMYKELNDLTVDEFRALNHLYWDHGMKVRMGQRASTICMMRGIIPSYQKRTVMVRGVPKATVVNVYPRSILDEALRHLNEADAYIAERFDA